MVVLFRCSIFPPSRLQKTPGRPIAAIFCPESELTDGIPVQKLEMLPYKTSKGIKNLSGSHQNAHRSWSMSTEHNVQMSVSKETLGVCRKYSNCCNIPLKDVTYHKRFAAIFAKTLLIANVSSIILPFTALAETCETENPIFNMTLGFCIAMIGATVGGLLARQRKGELARLNEQLRQINAALRRQANMESYAPTLSYALVGQAAETEVIVDARRDRLIANLRIGKNYLRNQNLDKAFVEFKAAFELADSLGDHIEKKKAARGLGASLQRLGKYREAITYHSKVLEIAQAAGEDSGSTEAYGAIADCYTELGDLERAGKFYDKYIARLETD